MWCTYSTVTWVMPHATTAVLARSVHTIQPCTMSCHFMQNNILRVHTCLAVTCHLHFWQNDWDLLCATVVTQGGVMQKPMLWQQAVARLRRVPMKTPVTYIFWTLKQMNCKTCLEIFMVTLKNFLLLLYFDMLKI